MKQPQTLRIGKSIVVRGVAKWLHNIRNSYHHDNIEKNIDDKKLFIEKHIFRYDKISDYTRLRKIIDKRNNEFIDKYFSDKKALNIKVVCGEKKKAIYRGKKKYQFRIAVSYNIIPPYYTEGCDNMDEMGFCQGHSMTRQEFINRFCNGIEPPEIK